MGRIFKMAKNKNTPVPTQKDSGRGLPVTSTSTPKPPTKPPAKPSSGTGTITKK